MLLPDAVGALDFHQGIRASGPTQDQVDLHIAFGQQAGELPIQAFIGIPGVEFGHDQVLEQIAVVARARDRWHSELVAHRPGHARVEQVELGRLAQLLADRAAESLDEKAHERVFQHPVPGLHGLYVRTHVPGDAAEIEDLA
jgi:hypothetical protein